MNNHLPASETQVFTNPIPIAVGHGPVTLSVRLLNRGSMAVRHAVQHRRLNAVEEPQFCKVGNVAECGFALLTGVYGRRWADWFLEQWRGLQREGGEGGVSLYRQRCAHDAARCGGVTQTRSAQRYCPQKSHCGHVLRLFASALPNLSFWQ